MREAAERQVVKIMADWECSGERGSRAGMTEPPFQGTAPDVPKGTTNPGGRRGEKQEGGTKCPRSLTPHPPLLDSQGR